jgi:hypothetical protein
MICASAVPNKPAKRRPAADSHEAIERARLEKVAPMYISSYFSETRLPDGVDLNGKRYVDMCVDLDIFSATDIAYRAMAKSGRFDASCKEGKIADDVLMVIGILRRIRMKCVPQKFSAGIMLMHLEFLEGISFSSET